MIATTTGSFFVGLVLVLALALAADDRAAEAGGIGEGGGVSRPQAHASSAAVE